MTPFGTTQSGETVHAIHLRRGALSATILTLGAILQDVRLDGMDHSLTLGSDNLHDYETTMQFHGSIVGPVANRLRNATAPINGTDHQFDANDGPHTLHSGHGGTHAKLWTPETVADDSATLTLTLPHGEAGFPGNRRITATFAILENATLQLTITTTSDAPTLANLTNHSYWNLDGTDHMRDHQLTIVADTYLPSDAETLPTGEVADVTNTPYDFRSPRALVPATPPLDTTFCVGHDRGPLTDRLTLHGAKGITLHVATTETGVHLYDAGGSNRPNGPFYEGLAIECQGWPDAPNHPDFPPIALQPDMPTVQITQWRFSDERFTAESV